MEAVKRAITKADGFEIVPAYKDIKEKNSSE
jgi:hypothetical protein